MPAAPRARKTAAAKKVDETVVNQENPGTSTEDRSPESTESAPEVAKAAPANNEVDVTVINQESLGSGEVVVRNPEPQLVTDSTGATFDVNKSVPELVDPDAEETELRRTRIRQNEGVLNAKDLVEDVDKDVPEIELEFLESGLTAQGRVWKKGQVLRFDETEDSRQAEADINGDVWYELSESEQKERYGKVFFEKR